jgi:hypothetical protein
MPLEPPRAFDTQRDRDQWARRVAVVPDTGVVTTEKIADHAVTSVKFRQSASASVVGRSESTRGDVDDITSSANDTLLIRRAGVLGWGDLLDSDVPASLARDTEVAAAIAALSSVYVALANVLNASASFDPPSLASGNGTLIAVTVTGAAMGDFALSSFSLDLQGITVTSYVSASNTVTVRFVNQTGTTLDLGNGVLKVRVWKQ